MGAWGNLDLGAWVDHRWFITMATPVDLDLKMMVVVCTRCDTHTYLHASIRPLHTLVIQLRESVRRSGARRIMAWYMGVGSPVKYISAPASIRTSSSTASVRESTLHNLESCLHLHKHKHKQSLSTRSHRIISNPSYLTNHPANW